MRPRKIRRIAAAMMAGAALAATGIVWSAESKAMPDPYFPVPPVWCPGGGTMTGWGGFCDGATFGDNTKWHMDAFSAPFVGMVWNPIVCVVADAPAPPPRAPRGGCGGAWGG